MKNKKDKEEKQDNRYVTFIDTTTSSSDLCTIVDSAATNTGVNFISDTISSNCVVTYNSSDLFIYNDPYQELEETKQQQEKEEELRKENSCLRNAWEEYQLILKLLEENECDKYGVKKYGNQRIRKRT
ncbi:hypothetical protein LCGC14_1732740 [marine sediment metagenome]|uniref:Uncharacterized protein n=1 Tax=marine sediment metagenome TaxID=412755 RepID=A0A0F9JPH4_9ZZZZ